MELVQRSLLRATACYVPYVEQFPIDSCHGHRHAQDFSSLSSFAF